MDASEATVQALLQHLGFSSVVYEPDGNVPPDFLADGRIAVEVRRLNQNHDSGDGKRGLEEAAIPLWNKVKKLVESLGSSTDQSWFVFYRFSRPVAPWKQLEPKLKSALVAFQKQASQSSAGIVRIYSENGFELEVFKATQAYPTYFLMGGHSDDQSGGFIVAEMLANIEHCAKEKLQKITKFRSKYREWWLALVDHIGLGLNDFDKQQFLEHAKRPAGWDKILVVSPSDPTRFIEY